MLYTILIPISSHLMLKMVELEHRVLYLLFLIYSANGLDVCEDKSNDCQPCNFSYPVPAPYRDNCMKTCQVCTNDKNIALNQTSNQSSTSHDIGNSSNAVDGNTNGIFNSRSCTHTRVTSPAWWCIDLKKIYNIDNITIFNRVQFGERLQGFELKTASSGQCNAAGFSTSSPCYKNDPPTNQSIHTIEKCNQDSNKSISAGTLFVSVNEALTICEFQVFTGIACSYGYYNTPSTTCKPCDGCSNNHCNPDTGDCIGVCKAGVYGTKCQQNCSEGCKNKQCNNSYGNCSCIDGWFGSRCEFTCNTGCKDGICDQNDGQCSQGCIPGRYGDQCNETCSKDCNNTVCDQNDGRCSQGCIQRRYGDKCNEMCSKGCSTTYCNRDGSCTCRDGYKGSYCQTLCDVNCRRCEVISCSLCKPGWFGMKCETRCPIGCKNECNKTSGTCDECKEGTLGRFCNITCGVDCRVICKEEYCEKNCSSNCNGSSCLPGIEKCRYECIGSKRMDICFKAIEEQLDSNPSSIAKVVVPILVIAVVLAIIFLLIISKKRIRTSMANLGLCARKNGNNQIDVDDSPLASPGFIANSDSVAVVENNTPPPSHGHENVANIAEPSIYQNVNVASRSPTRVDVKNLKDYTKRRKVDNSFKEEFQALPNGLCYAYDCGIRAPNKLKNRYKGVSAYDHSRVKLNIENNDPNSDYINACYITGFQDAEQKYIASQGPVDNMVEDFWRMVWFVNAGKIVMLTNLNEMGVQKCVQYWPNIGKEKQFGKITIRLVEEKFFSHFTIRKLEVTKEGWDPRFIEQFHYTAWPDKSTPGDIPSLIEFIYKVNQSTSSLSGPIVVHCSAGIGRTGTFIGLDYLIEEGGKMGSVDVAKCVEQMRYERVNMVQTLKQYIFLHEALVEVFVCSDTVSADIHEELFMRIESVRPVVTNDRFKAAMLEENKHKNRDMSVLPLDEFRFYLPYGGEGSSDYINAVFLPGYWKKGGYIITQTPLKKTVLDFWKMLMEAEVEIVVNMDTTVSHDDVGDYLPENGPLIVGDFTVTKIDEKRDSRGYYSVLTINVQHKNNSGVSRKIKFYQCRFWNSGKTTPTKVNPMLVLIDDVQLTSSNNDMGPPIVVMCLNGAKKSGLFCALSEVIERWKNEQSANILLNILQLKLYRPQIIPSSKQLKYCIDADGECADRYNPTYVNS